MTKKEEAQVVTEEVVDYEVLSDVPQGHLKRKVKEFIRTGWQPWGGPVVQSNIMYQVMVKWGVNGQIKKDN